MIIKRLVLLFVVTQAFCLPMTINFQMIVKDNTGRPVQFQAEQVTFTLIGSVSQFWTETKPFSTPTGIINTRLGSVTPLDPVSFYAQDSIRLVVLRANGDTLLSEPFNAVPYAYRASFADTTAKAHDAALLGGKRPDEYLSTEFIATIKQMVSDSVWARPQADPTGEISDTAEMVRSVLRQRITDSTAVIRGYAISRDSSVINTLRGEIRDSLLAHPGVDPSAEIHDTAETVRSNARAWIGDTAVSLRSAFSQRITDSLSSRFDQGLKTTSSVLFNSISLNNGNINTGTGDVITDSISSRIINNHSFLSDNDSIRFFPNQGWSNVNDSITLFLGSINSYLKNVYGGQGGFSICSENKLQIKSDNMLNLNSKSFITIQPDNPDDGIYLAGRISVGASFGAAPIDSITINTNGDSLRIWIANSSDPFVLRK